MSKRYNVKIPVSALALLGVVVVIWSSATNGMRSGSSVDIGSVIVQHLAAVGQASSNAAVADLAAELRDLAQILEQQAGEPTAGARVLMKRAGWTYHDYGFANEAAACFDIVAEWAQSEEQLLEATLWQGLCRPIDSMIAAEYLEQVWNQQNLSNELTSRLTCEAGRNYAMHLASQNRLEDAIDVLRSCATTFDVQDCRDLAIMTGIKLGYDHGFLPQAYELIELLGSDPVVESGLESIIVSVIIDSVTAWRGNNAELISMLSTTWEHDRVRVRPECIEVGLTLAEVQGRENNIVGQIVTLQEVRILWSDNEGAWRTDHGANMPDDVYERVLVHLVCAARESEQWTLVVSAGDELETRYPNSQMLDRLRVDIDFARMQ